MAFQLWWMIPLLAAVTFTVTLALGRVGWAGATDESTPRRPALIINGGDLIPAGGSGVLLADGVDTVFRGVEELAFTIETGRVSLYETLDGRDLADFGLVQVAGYPRPTATLLNAIAEYLNHRRVPAVNLAGVSAPTKLYQYVRFAQADLPVPATRYLPPRVLAGSYTSLSDTLGLPFVLKAIAASGGRHNYLIGNEIEFERRVRPDPDHGVRFLVQEFIPNDSTLRMLVLGGEVAVVIRLTGISASYLAETAPGSRATLVDPAELDPAVARLAVRAATLLHCDIAGINLIQHWTTRQWYVLDANSSPAIGTGAFVTDKLGAYSSYLKRRLSRS